MKTTFRKLAFALAASFACAAAQAGVLTWQDVVFTTTWSNNVLTLEIDAASRSGDWTRATMLSALSIKDIGSYGSVSVSAAPKGVDGWALTGHELNANGCSGGKGNGTKGVCLSGAPIKLTDDMVFKFTFTGSPVLSEPHLKVKFVDNKNGKVGDLLSQKIMASTAGIPEAPPVTPPPAAPEAPVVIPPPPPATNPPDQNPTPPPVVTVPDNQDSGEVPEPQTVALLLAGLLLMGAALRKRG